MLHRLEEDHSLSSPARVPDYFDMVCGSGLGGLLAIMCGILRMTGNQLVEESVRLCESVFSDQLDVAQRTVRLEEEIKRIVAKFSEGNEERKMLFEEDTCKTFVCAAPAYNASHARLFRTYRSRTNASLDCTLWEAARATTATPSLFSPIFIGPEHIGEIFVSGELGWNNPTNELTEEAAQAFIGRHIACIISIGSGHPGHLSLSHGLPSLFSRISLDCERGVENMERRFGKVPDVYRRLNVDQGMQNLDVDLSNLHEVVSHAQSYLQGSQITRNIDSVLQDLVMRPEKVSVDMVSGIIPSSSAVLHLKVCPLPTPYFSGRKIELRTMEEHFASPSDSCRVVVLYGIGGGGKTQIGLKFIQLSQDRFSEIFFVDASDKLTLESNLKAIANQISEKPSVDDALRLLRTRREDWLLFLDNADDTTLDLRSYVSWPHGNVLITTRNREARSHAPKCNIWVDKLELEDATNLLLGGVSVERCTETDDLASKIVHELGYLALAINQARAFLAIGLCTLKEYLPIYTQNRKTLLEDKSIQSTDDYKHTVYTTWTISFDKLSPDAALFLELLSYMHHESIPCHLFENAWKAFGREAAGAVPQTVITFLSKFTTVDSTWDILRFRKLIGEIVSFSLLNFNAINYSISLHPLVQQWAQHYTQRQHEVIHATQALLCLGTPTGGSEQDYAMIMSLLPHVRESAKSGFSLHYSLLPYVGYVYEHGGMFQESSEIWRRALPEMQQQLGPTHAETLGCMSNLATTYWELGRSREALKLNEEVFEFRKRTLGHKDPGTLVTMNNLAQVYLDLGQYQQALKLNQESLELTKLVLGDEHQITLKTMSNLAHVYSKLRRHLDALELNLEVLELRKRVLGHKHPDTLVTMSNLAFVLSCLGKQQDTLKLNQELLELRKQVLGDEHPATLNTMSNLAHDYSTLGRYQDALKLNEEMLNLKKQVLGPRHPNTLKCMSDVATTYRDLGRYHKALKLNEEVLELGKGLADDNHTGTLVTLNNLAQVYSDLGQYQVALKLYEEVLGPIKDVLGEDDSNTLTVMGNLALVYSKLGRHDDALKLNQKVLEQRKHILGHSHSDTLMTMSNLAYDYSCLGQDQDALKLNQEVLELRKMALGKNHPHTLMSMNNLALDYSDLGQHQDAVKLYDEVLEPIKNVLGEEHPTTLLTMSNRAHIYSRLGWYQVALKLNQEVFELRCNILGFEHPDTIVSLNEVERLRAELHDGETIKLKGPKKHNVVKRLFTHFLK
ncbi:hypothetical protein DL96DRAFT_1723450 [Flagelloscypha sp. PMI_526]|nr:hypothetical protein DL96DRAFT_1723450 [Flagelloscypha sp. PMI_526]